MTDSVCAIVVDGSPATLAVLPCMIVYHGKVYRLAVSDGRRRGLILTRPSEGGLPVKKRFDRGGEERYISS